MQIHVFHFPYRSVEAQRVRDDIAKALLRSVAMNFDYASYGDLGDDYLGETEMELVGGPWRCRGELYLMDTFQMAGSGFSIVADFAQVDVRAEDHRVDLATPKTYGAYGFVVVLPGQSGLQAQISAAEIDDEDTDPSWDPFHDQLAALASNPDGESTSYALCVLD